jgi:hypothetical protein
MGGIVAEGTLRNQQSTILSIIPIRHIASFYSSSVGAGKWRTLLSISICRDESSNLTRRDVACNVSTKILMQGLQ